MKTTIKKMSHSDLAQVIAVQRETFTAELCEDLDVFENRFAIFGDYFQIALLENKIVGYMLCFPWKLGESPVNNQKFPQKLPEFNCFYIHDITLLPIARGSGLAQQMIAVASKMACDLGHKQLSLVSVEQSGNYWDRCGFHPYQNLSQEKCAWLKEVYGQGARLMVRDIIKGAL